MSDNWVVQNLENALNTWNEKLAEIWQLITQSPENFKGGTIWNVIVDIHGAVQAIGLALLVLFFVVGVMRTCGNFAEVKRPEQALKLFIRFAIAKGAVTYGLELTMVHTADSKEQLDNDTEALLTTARKHLCQFAVLKYQQMDGLNTALPFGVRKIDALRTLTSPRASMRNTRLFSLIPSQSRQSMKSSLYLRLWRIVLRASDTTTLLMRRMRKILIPISGSARSLLCMIQV